MHSSALKQAGRSAAAAVARIPLVKPGLRPLSKAGLLPYSIWMRLPVSETFEVSTNGVCFRYASVGGDDLGRILYWKGPTAFEGETITEFARLAASARVVVDVGACSGFYTLLALACNPQSRVIAFEPVAANRKRVEANLAVNGWSARCSLRPECVSSECRMAWFHVPYTPEGGVVSSSSLNPNGFHGLGGELVETVCTTLDAAVPAGTPVDLVKIDVEGFEGAVLEGMRRIIFEQSPTIILECSDETRDADALLQEFGYDIYHIRAGELVPVTALTPDDIFRNYLATPKASEKGAASPMPV
jgi:FkbM family methyltransferase